MMTVTQYFLGKLAEEAAEVAKEALKAQQFGITTIEPGKTQTNMERISAELNDLQAMVLRLNSELDFNHDPDMKAIMKKISVVESYKQVCQDLGHVEK